MYSQANQNGIPMRTRTPLFLLIGPSAVGKTTIADSIMQRNNLVKRPVTSTTRKRRPGEVDGKDYIFMSREGFMNAINDGQFLEHANVHGNMYGTPAKSVADIFSYGCIPLLIIDVNGAISIQAKVKNTVSVFVSHVADVVLQERLIARGASEDEICKRMETMEKEVSMKHFFDYIVYNYEGELNRTVSLIEKIMVGHSGHLRS